MTGAVWLYVLAFAGWVAWVVIIRPWKASRPRPVYKIKGDKIYRA